jgi:T-complex protein 1 subunit eta
LGTCGSFQEKQIGAERFNLFEECPHVILCLISDKISHNHLKRWC